MSLCPPSPPPVLSVTSAFFQSPFSTSNRNRPTNQQSPRTATLSSTSITTSSGQYQKMMAKEEDENHDHNPSAYGLSWKPPITRLSSDWTPLSSRSSPYNNNQHQPHIHSQDQQLTSTEDRLDRILAEMNSTPPSSPCKPMIPSNTCNSMTSHNKPTFKSVECWERSSLEIRFHPLHTSITSATIRPCLKLGSISSSDSTSSSDTKSSNLSSFSCSQVDSFHTCCLLAHPPPELVHHRTAISVRFDDDSIEEFFTWSRESYDRRGPQPITKLNIREMLELKSIKEELGISSSNSNSIPSTSASKSSFAIDHDTCLVPK